MKSNSNDAGIYNPDENSHFRADSALLKFLGLGLGGPESSLDECKARPCVVRVRKTRRRGRSRSGPLQSPARNAHPR